MSDPIPQYLHIAGIRRDDPEWGLQYNLMHASLGNLGVRKGLDHRCKSVLRSRGLGVATKEALSEFQRVIGRSVIESPGFARFLLDLGVIQ